jgi:DNA gyrase subunit B
MAKKQKKIKGKSIKKTSAETDQNGQNSVSYEAKDIYVLEGLEPVQRRPAMYIGSTGVDGLHHLVWEVVDNSIDEAMAGYAKNIKVELLKDNQVAVTDDGRGIPVEIHPQTKKSALETVMCTLHAGGKFGGESYKVAGGLHGVGVSVVNALSKWLRVEVCRNANLYSQEYQQGEPKYKARKEGKCEQTGTKVIFEPDPKIFPKIEFDLKKILNHLRQQAYLTPKLRIEIIDERSSNPEAYGFYFEGGLKSFIKYLLASKEPIQNQIFYQSQNYENILVESAFVYTNDIEVQEVSFANNIYTPDGGMHLTGFRSALTRTINDFGRQESYLKESEDNLIGDDVREGLIAVVSVKLREPQFEGQTKARLGNPEARTAVEAVITEALKEFFERYPAEARKIVEKCLLTAKARQAAKAAKETVLRKGVLEGMTLPGKLADCSTRNPEESELFIVEGDSAGGCFLGDTKVALTDGRNISFKDLVEEDKRGKKNFCYTIKNDGNIGVELIKNPRETKNNAEVIKIILDNNEELICTPDHKFMLRDGSYKMAKDLIPNDSLMPLYRQYSKMGRKITIEGYELISNPKDNKWISEISKNQWADFNLRKWRAEMTKKQWTREFRDKRKKAYNQVRKLKNDKSLIRYDTICGRFFNGDENKLKETVLNYNHRIKSIIPLKEKINVYDIEVPGSHNFALASGVFVHNSAKQGRDRRTQAILPLRGKILNVEKARMDKMLMNQEIRALIIAIGTAIGDAFDFSKLRYYKIIIMTDADTDGAHIRTLLLTLFYRYFVSIIENGHLYIAQPPLYRLQKNKEIHYAYKEAEKERVLKSFSDGGKVGVTIQRYKGLGEMNPEQLWETTMNSVSRQLKQVTIEDAVEADRLFDILMGEEVEPRKKFIQAHATAVKNLDI